MKHLLHSYCGQQSKLSPHPTQCRGRPDALLPSVAASGDRPQHLGAVVLTVAQKRYEIDNVERRTRGDKPEDHWSCIAHLSAEDMLK